MALAGFGSSAKEIIGRRLRAVRDHLGLTQEQMADAIGMDMGIYQHRESARSTLTPAEAWKVFTALGIDPRFVLFGDVQALGRDWPRVKATLLAQDRPEVGAPAKRGRPKKLRLATEAP